MILRAAIPDDFNAVLALNEESVRFLSPLTPERLAHLDGEAELHLVLEDGGVVVGFLLAFREGADYDSVNYEWFAERYDKFLYVDRVVVSRLRQGSGAGGLFYERVFAHAETTGVPLVTCEFDVDPPNAISERFHAKFGFREVGQQTVAGGKKSVSLQASVVQA